MNLQLIGDGIYRLEGSTAGGLLVRDGYGLLIDVPELPQELSIMDLLTEANVHTIDMILLTQHRRAFCGGIFSLPEPFPPILATEPESRLLTDADRIWQKQSGQYHRYYCVPDRFLPLRSLPAQGGIREDEPICWRGLTITPVIFGALSHGDCAYVVDDGKTRIAFCGALAMADGKIHDVYSFQKALPGMMGYHGYLGGLPGWMDGADRLLRLKPDLLVPAYGVPDSNPTECICLLRDRLRRYAGAYARISAVHYYFPELFRHGFEEPLSLSVSGMRAASARRPDWIPRIGETTSCLIRSESGRAILVDTGDPRAIRAVQDMLADGRLKGLDACWITHIHDDHLNAIPMLASLPDCEILTTAAVAEVIRQPDAWFLPALGECSVRCRVIPHGTSWRWENLQLTALDLPGQCIWHSGLLADDGQTRVLLCGDSFAPTGLDDYCADNRNLPGKGRGYRLCAELLRRYKPDCLINQHQTEPFVYDEACLQSLEEGLDHRETLLAELLPKGIGLGSDSQWMRCWPMEQTVTRGSVLRLSVQLTGHENHAVRISPRLPWRNAPALCCDMVTDGPSTGSVSFASEHLPADSWAHLDVRLPDELTGDFRIPFDCWMDGDYLGSFLSCTIHIL